MKKIGYGFLALIVVVGVLALFNLERLQRLNAVNTLFSEELIVENFSNMDELFFNIPIPVETSDTPWPEDTKPIAQAFSYNGTEYQIAEWQEYSNATSLLVIHNGAIAHEEYLNGTDADDLRVSWSVAKSFLSAAFGVAVSNGKIDLQKPVDSYVPELSNSAYAGVTVRNVLNMASGVRFNEDYLDFWSDINKMGRVLALGGSMDEFAAGISERAREAGEARQYVSIDTHVLAMVLRAAVDQTLPEYIAETIMNPLGFRTQPYYLTDSEGNAFALGGLNVTTRDFARFGQMFLDQGSWQGREIVPSGWVLVSTAPSAPTTADGDTFDYGYQWWIPPDSSSNGGDYLARGIYGQYIFISPATETVIVRTAANRKFRELLEDGSHPSLVDVAMFRAIANSVSQ